MKPRTRDHEHTAPAADDRTRGYRTSACAIPAILQWRPDADDRDGPELQQRQRPHDPIKAALQIAFGFRDQPAAAKQRIGDHQREAGEQAERREPAEGVARIAAVGDRDALRNAPSTMP